MIERKPLRDDIQRDIIARIADGRLGPGQRINETHLSADLGISRTPLREAMITLGAAGFLRADMGRGYRVPELDAREFVELQAVLARLAPFSLSLSGPPAPGRLMELANVLGRAGLPQGQGLALDEALMRWTRLLVEDCPNRLLRAEILRLDALSRRYWHAAAANGLDPEPVLRSLHTIYELLRAKKVTDARQAWTEHLARFTGVAKSLLPAAG